MTDYCLRFEQQAEQPNGFWLSHWQQIGCEGNDADLEPLPFNASFECGKTSFQLISQQQNRYQFLAQSPLNPPSNEWIMSLKKHQAWCFLPELMTSLNTERPLLITASNQANAMALYLCQQLKNHFTIRVLLHSDQGFPFAVKPARFLWENAPNEAIGAAPLLEDWQIPNRLCHTPFQPGCFEGTLEDFLKKWSPEPHPQILHCNDY